MIELRKIVRDAINSLTMTLMHHFRAQAHLRCLPLSELNRETQRRKKEIARNLREAENQKMSNRKTRQRFPVAGCRCCATYWRRRRRLAAPFHLNRCKAKLILCVSINMRQNQFEKFANAKCWMIRGGHENNWPGFSQPLRGRKMRQRFENIERA